MAVFKVKHPERRDEEIGAVRIRYSYMTLAFQDNSKTRLSVMTDNNGIVVMRAGRQIDVVTKVPPPNQTTFVNYDRNWGIEIDFDPTLDEYFGVTTNKQQITITEGMWEMLKQNGLFNALREMRARIRREVEDKKAKKRLLEKKDSEQVAAETQKVRIRKSVPPSAEKEKKSKELLEQETKRLAKETDKPVEVIKNEIESKPYKVDFEDLPGAPFYRMLQVGGQKQLRINLGHRFYSDVYSGPDASPRLQAALELLLIVLGECELDTEQERADFYKSERAEWSRRLEIVLEALDKRDPLMDRKSAIDAFDESAIVQ